MNGSILLAMGAVALMLCATTLLLVIDSRSRLVAQRTQSVVRPYAPAAPTAAFRSARISGIAVQRPVLDRIADLICLERNRPDLYPAPWWVMFLGSIIASFVLAKLLIHVVGSAGWIVWPALSLLGARWAFRLFRERYQRTLHQQMPDALSMIVRSVRAGLPVTEAFSIVAREAPALTAREFALLHAQVSVGMITDDALWAMAERVRIHEYRFLAIALTLQGQTGGNLAETLDNLSDVIRKRIALRRRGRALASEARATGLALCALPFVVASAMLVVSPDYISLLVNDPLGNKVLMGAAALMSLGIWSMRTLMRRTLS
ncbi:MAG TPA: type II secretion system F family protein [Acetobacteraceae bacterium]